MIFDVLWTTELSGYLLRVYVSAWILVMDEKLLKFSAFLEYFQAVHDRPYPSEKERRCIELEHTIAKSATGTAPLREIFMGVRTGAGWDHCAPPGQKDVNN